MRIFTQTILSIIMLFAFQSVFANHLSASLQMSSKLSGGEEVPPVITEAVGVASFVLNEDRDEICFNVAVNGLSGPITGIHVHEGQPGATGGVVTGLTSFVIGNRVAGSISGADLTPAMIDKYLSGDYYLNVHTAANPDGEIRGQITLETDYSYFTTLSGANEVPPVTTDAEGVGVFNLARHKGLLDINVTVDGLSGPITGAHFHSGAAGTNGGVVVDLTAMVDGNQIIGSIDPADILIDLEAGNIYLNVHTADNPGGEIRGQVVISPRVISFDATVNGAQEVPPVTTDAKGTAHIVIDNTLNQIRFEIQATGLSGPITGAHFHTGATGVNGAVLFDLAANVTDNRISGSITTGVTTEVINQFLTGGIYLNIHTAANPGGEIRGQVFRLTRESYTMSLDGGQQVPPVSVPAKGAGIVTISRDFSNAHIMIVFSDLTGPLNGFHLHNAQSVLIGDVIYNLGPFTTGTGNDNYDAAFTYWKNTDTPPFTTADEVKFRNNEVYSNVHTSAYPNGEIRGQSLRGSTCYDITYIREAYADKLEATLYPVPLVDSSPLRLDVETAELIPNTVVRVTDVLGKTITTQEVDFNVGTNNLQFEHSNWTTGIYFVQIEAEGQTIYSSKLIKY